MKSPVSRFLFSLYRPIIYLNAVINTFILAGIAIVVSIFDSNGNTVHYVGKFWSRINLFFTGVRVRVKGLENIDPGRPYIIMSNHQSYFDVWALIGYMPLQLRWVMKKELRKVPFFGYGCARMGHIYVDRGKSEKAKKSLEAAGEKIRAGASVVFFPEGTRSPDGKLLHFKKGGFVVALAAGAQILPITVNGGSFILPRGTWKNRSGTIVINIHPPMTVDSYTYETKGALMDEVRKVIESKL